MNLAIKFNSRDSRKLTSSAASCERQWPLRSASCRPADMTNASSSAPQQFSPGTSGASCRALRRAVSKLYRLDDFERKLLARGFFSEVYMVRHLATGQVMALKMNVIRQNRPNLLREVQLMNRLKHPNILRLVGVCVHEGQIHALTEFCDGGSLEMLLADKSVNLSWSTRIQLTRDISRGMRYLHSKNFMHRDLTSKNILIRRHGDYVNSSRPRPMQHCGMMPSTSLATGSMTAVICDFGFATPIPDPLLDGSKELQVVGSPWWMAPECFLNKIYNERVDIYSFGVILCETIARVEADPDSLPRSPKNFEIDFAAFDKIVPDDCPTVLHQLAVDCCRFEPKARPTFIDIVNTLENVVQYFPNSNPDFRKTTKNEDTKSSLQRTVSSDSNEDILEEEERAGLNAQPASERSTIRAHCVESIACRIQISSQLPAVDFARRILPFTNSETKIIPSDYYDSGAALSPLKTYTPPCTPCPPFDDEVPRVSRRRCNSLTTLSPTTFFKFSREFRRSVGECLSTAKGSCSTGQDGCGAVEDIEPSSRSSCSKLLNAAPQASYCNLTVECGGCLNSPGGDSLIGGRSREDDCDSIAVEDNYVEQYLRSTNATEEDDQLVAEYLLLLSRDADAYHLAEVASGISPNDITTGAGSRPLSFGNSSGFSEGYGSGSGYSGVSLSSSLSSFCGTIATGSVSDRYLPIYDSSSSDGHLNALGGSKEGEFISAEQFRRLWRFFEYKQCSGSGGADCSGGLGIDNSCLTEAFRRLNLHREYRSELSNVLLQRRVQELKRKWESENAQTKGSLEVQKNWNRKTHNHQLMNTDEKQ